MNSKEKIDYYAKAFGIVPREDTTQIQNTELFWMELLGYRCHGTYDLKEEVPRMIGFMFMPLPDVAEHFSEILETSENDLQIGAVRDISGKVLAGEVAVYVKTERKK